MDSLMISDQVAAKILSIRKSQGVTREQLAQRCADIGNGITAASLNNIETGRPDKDGTRRRHITIDELLVLAKALNVSTSELCSEISGESEWFQKFNDERARVRKALIVLTEI